MDSTSQRNINFSSMHIMANTESTHQQLYLAVQSTPDHTSETQVAVLKDSVAAVCDTVKRAPKCPTNPNTILAPSDVARKLCGANGDHAKDQIKVAELERQWKVDSWVQHLDNLALSDLGDTEAEQVYQEVQHNSEVAAGGADILAGLSLDDQETYRAAEYQKLITQLGSAELDRSSSHAVFDYSQVIRGVCCAHKDMNAVKGGASGMLAFWKENKMITPPVILFNKDNDATVTLADTSTNASLSEQRAIAVSEAGAVKLCSLAGAVFNHKDDKKGLQDSHTYWFEAHHHCIRRFPDTSNVRYGSYIDAATELCVLHGAYIDFMEHCRRKKTSGALNHMENNVLKALNCPATLAELLVIALYGQFLSKPYMRLVRAATVAGKGLADLAKLHTKVLRHLDLIIACPALVLGPDAVAATATLDGSEWDRPEVIDALRRHQSELPYLESLLVAFCRGASQTWVRFTDEFALDAPLASLSPEQRNLAFMPPTNDVNEGALGTWRVWTRRYPRLTLHKYNALMANHANGTEAYMESDFTSEQYTWSMAEARRIDSSKLEENRKTELVLAAEKEAEKNQVIEDRRADKRVQKQQYIAGIQLELDQSVIAKMKGAQLDDQLKLYRHMLANQQGFPSTSKLRVEGKRAVVAEMASKYVQARSILQSSSG
ncbi:hypothetical protein FRC12_010657 [Ceratobasidium sp. 428]|nr:hypothetical protein FRC12_010657 [Ceratobasidium sp. 428]